MADWETSEIQDNEVLKYMKHLLRYFHGIDRDEIDSVTANKICIIVTLR